MSKYEVELVGSATLLILSREPFRVVASLNCEPLLFGTEEDVQRLWRQAQAMADALTALDVREGAVTWTS